MSGLGPPNARGGRTQGTACPEQTGNSRQCERRRPTPQGWAAGSPRTRARQGGDSDTVREAQQCLDQLEEIGIPR